MENRRKFLKAASCIAGATLLGSNTSWAAFLTEEPTAKKIWNPIIHFARCNQRKGKRDNYSFSQDGIYTNREL